MIGSHTVNSHSLYQNSYSQDITYIPSETTMDFMTILWLLTGNFLICFSFLKDQVWIVLSYVSLPVYN